MSNDRVVLKRSRRFSVAAIMASSLLLLAHHIQYLQDNGSPEIIDNPYGAMFSVLPLVLVPLIVFVIAIEVMSTVRGGYIEIDSTGIINNFPSSRLHSIPWKEVMFVSVKRELLGAALIVSVKNAGVRASDEVRAEPAKSSFYRERHVFGMLAISRADESEIERLARSYANGGEI